MGDAERADYVRKLRAALARGEGLRAAAKAAGTSKSTAQRLAEAEQLPRRRPRKRLSPAVKKAIRRDIASARLTLRQIARLHKTSLRSVQRVGNPAVPGSPRRVRPYRCPGCGLRVELKPCMVCVARVPGPS